MELCFDWKKNSSHKDLRQFQIFLVPRKTDPHILGVDMATIKREIRTSLHKLFWYKYFFISPEAYHLCKINCNKHNIRFASVKNTFNKFCLLCWISYLVRYDFMSLLFLVGNEIIRHQSFLFIHEILIIKSVWKTNLE